MSKIFPDKLADALTDIYDIVVDLVGNPAKLYRADISINSFDEEVCTYPTYPNNGEDILCYLKFSDIPELFNGILFDEEELPIMAYMKVHDNIKYGDVLEVTLKNVQRGERVHSYKVVDVIGKVTSNTNIYSLFKVVPFRIPV